MSCAQDELTDSNTWTGVVGKPWDPRRDLSTFGFHVLIMGTYKRKTNMNVSLEKLAFLKSNAVQQ